MFKYLEFDNKVKSLVFFEINMGSSWFVLFIKLLFSSFIIVLIFIYFVNEFVKVSLVVLMYVWYLI